MHCARRREAELARLVAAPAREPAVAGECTGEVAAARERGDLHEPGDRDRLVALAFVAGAGAELTGDVVAPARDRTAAAQRAPNREFSRRTPTWSVWTSQFDVG